MIDAATGSVTLSGVVVGASTTLAQLRRSPLGKELVDESAGKPPTKTYSAGVREIGDQRFTVWLTFDGGRLQSVNLSLHDPKETASWDTWSEKREKQRKKKHDALLEKTLGPPTHSDVVGAHYELPWGQVLSSFDPRSASSEVVVSYSTTARRKFRAPSRRVK
jgi:hypothetical protein